MGDWGSKDSGWKTGDSGWGGSKDSGWKTGDSGWGGKGSAAKSEWHQTNGWNHAHAGSHNSGASHIRHRPKLSFSAMTFYLILVELVFWFYVYS